MHGIPGIILHILYPLWKEIYLNLGENIVVFHIEGHIMLLL